MKKILFIMLVQVFVVKIAFAQKGTGNNSDWKVPVPIISPQIDITINGNPINVPSMPSIPPSGYSPGLTIAPRNLVPSVPTTPLAPPVPPSGALPSAPNGVLKIKVPTQPILPPLPTIQLGPTVKIPIA